MALALIWLILFVRGLMKICKYTGGAILKWSVSGAKIRKDFGFQPTVSVILPCYNEGRAVYEAIGSISGSDYPNDRFEIIAHDDCSVDDSFQWMLRAQWNFPNRPVIGVRTAANSAQ